MGLALATLPMSAIVTIEGDENEYATISAAVAEAPTGSTIHVTESYLEETTINPGEKNLTIKGEEGVVVSFKGQFVVSLQNAACSLSIENITFENTLTSTNTRNTFAIGRGSIYLTNVTIDGADVNNAAGIISLNNSNSNIPNAQFDNVKIVNSSIEGAPAQVVVNNSNLTLSGDTELSIQLKGSNTIKSAENFTGNVTLVLDEGRALNTVVVYNCTDSSHFTLENMEGLTLQPQDGNLILAEVPAILNATTGVGYSSINTAVAEAESGATLILNKDITFTSRPTLGGKALTIKGATGNEKIIRGEGFGVYFFMLNNEADNLTLENLTIDGNNVETTASMFQPAAGASLTLKNVEVTNCLTTNARGLIDNNNSNPGTWHMDGVRFTDCEVPNQTVTANAAGNTIKGSNDFTLRVNGDFTVDASGIDNATPLHVYVDKPDLGRIVITHCWTDDQFVCDNSGLFLTPENGNLEISLYSIPTGIENVEIDSQAAATFYNLKGEVVEPSTPGLYILKQGTTVRKVYVK